jgi:hypothetical protein
MKVTKITFTLALALSLSPLAFANLNDDLDKNTDPAFLEEREEEAINLNDRVDRNAMPATLEEREKEEEVESDQLQLDDPEQSYDTGDEEYDEN